MFSQSFLIEPQSEYRLLQISAGRLLFERMGHRFLLSYDNLDILSWSQGDTVKPTLAPIFFSLNLSLKHAGSIRSPSIASRISPTSRAGFFGG